MAKLIKLFDPSITGDEIRATVRVLESKFWASGSGVNNVVQFERAFKRYTGAKAAVAVSNGSAALHLGLSLFDLKNREVLVPSLTFVSTVHAIIQNGGKPVFIDIDPLTLCMDVKKAKKRISGKTGAILAVHFGGMPSDLKELKRMSSEYGIPIIEDAAHACGSLYDGKRIGSHSDLVCFSFHPVKNLAMPLGGAVCINKNPVKFKKILDSKRWCGITDRKGYHYDVDKMGWNYYMNEISASIGLVQLKRLDRMNKVRAKIARRYSKELSTESKMPFSDECSYHLYWIRTKKRNEFMKKMDSKGIQTGIHYNPVHLMAYYERYSKKLPVTEQVGREIVSIPIHPNLTQKDVDRVISSVNDLI